ncbi:hypothetical protein K490DRAFT_54113 [Saccharata proteae CBS 121410]|uniref:Uncharacterized protein n=1 Tax=Saccharata proteae CBS 121410 TaxID=1314787 RepID=A0A9P4I2B3_9PEZI|nr:hypothetical protein K490DRAFT_54113 [Saccharata proteae CBS 121410]
MRLVASDLLMRERHHPRATRTPPPGKPYFEHALFTFTSSSLCCRQSSVSSIDISTYEPSTLHAVPEVVQSPLLFVFCCPSTTSGIVDSLLSSRQPSSILRVIAAVEAYAVTMPFLAIMLGLSIVLIKTVALAAFTLYIRDA